MKKFRVWFKSGKNTDYREVEAVDMDAAEVKVITGKRAHLMTEWIQEQA